ncbi:hypothetical protein TNIN_495231 [Trichonephila inaurata madagascariensis]|uniref:Uncharacterized protein n=1 Tax=Trichonephila inaurata madagascariensis TaxID=2747483 RepID=A0A8X7BXX9_9ARAC|nr:hypothetical protein TNIN_495231 [Trichonephila inaurata madagascariensis]
MSLPRPLKYSSASSALLKMSTTLRCPKGLNRPDRPLPHDNQFGTRAGECLCHSFAQREIDQFCWRCARWCLFDRILRDEIMRRKIGQ